MKLLNICKTSVTGSALLSTYKEMYGNTCRTLLSQHLLIKTLFEWTPERDWLCR